MFLLDFVTDSSPNNRSWNYTSKGFSYSSFGNNTDKSQQGSSSTNQNRNATQSFAYRSKFNDSSLW